MPDNIPQILLFAGEFQVRGSSAYTLRLADHLPQLGFAARIVCSNAEIVKTAQRQGLTIAEYPHLKMPFVGHLALHRMLHDLENAVPDLIHIQSRSVLTQGCWLARTLKRPFILTVHDYLSPYERLRIDWQWCRHVIAVSESVKRDFSSRLSVPPGRLTVIPSGVDPPVIPDLAPPLDAGHVPVVGTAGPLEAVKGLPFFLGAAQKVLATGRDVEFLVAGAGPEEANLRRLARELNIAHKVTFVPYLHDFTESLAAMDIFCLPSLQQGLGTIMLEAMALGRPVIASRVGGVYSVVHDRETGLLVPPSDSSQLADRILELLNDPVRARAIGEAARQMVRRDFSLQKMVEQTADVYRSVLAEAKADALAPGTRA